MCLRFAIAVVFVVVSVFVCRGCVLWLCVVVACFRLCVCGCVLVIVFVAVYL